MAVLPGSTIHLDCMYPRRRGSPEWTWTGWFRQYLTGAWINLCDWSITLACHFEMKTQAKLQMGRRLRSEKLSTMAFQFLSKSHNFHKKKNLLSKKILQRPPRFCMIQDRMKCGHLCKSSVKLRTRHKIKRIQIQIESIVRATTRYNEWKMQDYHLE